MLVNRHYYCSYYYYSACYEALRDLAWVVFPKLSSVLQNRGVDLEPIVSQHMQEQFDSLGIDSTSHVRPSASSLLSLNSQD